MADDLANGWGTGLCIPPRTSRSPQAFSTETDNTDFQLLKQEIRGTFNGEFHLVKVTPCGSDANLFACVKSTGGDLSRTLVAAGSYVAGTEFGLQNWSTSDFQTQYGLAVITQPHLVTDPFCTAHTVGLPYHIPGVMKPEDLEKYEDQCLLELHHRCLISKMNDAPVKTLLMEIMLAGNGATLSDRALERIAQLARMHQFSVTLDEIFTGGRSGTMLLAQQTPHSFRSAVRYVTMGKWIGAGLVIATKQEYLYMTNAIDTDESGPRGTSTKIDCQYLLLVWKEVQKKIILTPGRRETVLRKLNIPVGKDWGRGVMIYCSKARADSAQGLKNRFLPMLENTHIDSFKVVDKKEEWCKAEVNSLIVDGTNSWVNIRERIIEAKEADEKKTDDDSKENLLRAIHQFVELIASPHQRVGNRFLKKELKDLFMPDADISASTVRLVGQLAKNNKIIHYKRVGSLRHETYFIEPMAILPWFHMDSAPVSRDKLPRKFGAPYPSTTGGGIYLLGERVAVDKSSENTTPYNAVMHGTASKLIQFGTVKQYNPPKTNQKESWYIRWDHQEEEEEEEECDKVSLDILQDLLNQYNCHCNSDRDPNRFDGYKVARMYKGSQMMWGVVKKCDDWKGRQQFKIKYEDSLLEEWVNESEVRSMRMLWKKHHLHNNTSHPSIVCNKRKFLQDCTNQKMG